MYGEESLSIFLAFLAGLVSFASPCVLPLVPSYLGFIAGSGGGPGASGFAGFLSSTLARTLAFVLGFTIVFTVLGLLFAGGGIAFGGLREGIQIASGIIVIVFALNLVFNFLPFLNYEARAQVQKKPATLAGAVVVGMAFGAGWTPCIGPILSTILFMAAASADPFLGILYLLVYGLGLGLPFIVLSLGLDRFRPLLKWMTRHLRAIKLVSAAVLLVMGLLILFGQTTLLTRILPQSGTMLERWSAANVLPARAIGTAVLVLVFVLPGLLGLLKKYRSFKTTHDGGPGGESPHPLDERSPSFEAGEPWALSFKPGRLSILFIVVGLVLAVLELSGVLNLLAVLGRWFQFQGI